MKSEYTQFNQHKSELIRRMSEGVDASEIITRIESKFNLSEHVKLLISGLGKSPESQSVNEWLAEYVNS
jgi:hypothetical protein